MKKLTAAVFSFFLLYFIRREYIHALEYIYRLSLCRGSKAFLFNCNNIENELEAMGKMAGEIDGIKKWANSTKPERRYLCSTEGRPLYMRVFRQKEYSDRWVIAVHGYGCTGKSMLACARELYENGYNVIVPDLPCHGSSYGRVIGMGQYEYRDILKIAAFIARGDENARIMLYGVSMGAATVLMAAARAGDRKNIFCAVSDCSFTSAREILGFQFSNIFRVPAFPLVRDLDRIYNKKTGLWLKRADIVKSVKNSRLPTLFIHGSSDGIVPTFMVYRLYNAAGGPKDIEIIKDAGHGVSAYKDKETYWSRVFGFADKYYVNEA